MFKPAILFFFSFLFLLNVASADQKPYVVSGFDDVLRQAENTGLIKAAIKILEDDKGFSGMPELYQVISQQEKPPQFVLVSAISNWFDKRIDNFLAKSHLPSNKRYLRNWLIEWPIEKFKIEKIRKILNDNPQRQYIVIFDNSDASINLAKEIKQQFSKNVAAIYLRQVQKKKLPPEAIGFYTAFDIAVNEYKAGRLSSDEVSKVAEAVLTETDIHSLIPEYAMCPQEGSSCGSLSSDIQELCLKLSQHVRTLCRH